MQIPRESLFCTLLPCYWLPPTFKSVPFARICEIDFSAPQRKYIKLVDDQQVTLNTLSNDHDDTFPVSTSDLTPSESEIDYFYKALSKTGKPAIFSIVPGFCEAYVPL